MGISVPRLSLWPGLAILAAGLILTTACKNQPAGQAASPAAGTAATPSPWKMALTLTPDPPVSEKETAFQVKLTDDAGKSVAGAEVKAALVMATMDMGKNELAFSDQGGGTYRASGKFTMAGPWNVAVTGAAAGKTGQQVFQIVVHEE